MFARMLRIQTHLDRIDEAAKIFEEHVIPLVKETKGHKGAYFMADRKTATVTSSPCGKPKRIFSKQNTADSSRNN